MWNDFSAAALKLSSPTPSPPREAVKPLHTEAREVLQCSCSYLTTILLALLCHEKRYQDLQGDIFPNFPHLIATWLYAVFWLKGYLVWLPLGLEATAAAGESFGFLFPPKERLLRRPHTLWRRPKPGISSFWARGVICGFVEVVAVVQDIYYQLEWSECRRRQGQTIKCIAAVYNSQMQFWIMLSIQDDSVLHY